MSVLSWRPKTVPDCSIPMLSTLKAAVEGLRYEIIVIEGGSSDNTADILRKHGITQIYNEAQCLGPGRHSWPQLYNFGFSKACGKWAMYASDDTVFGKESVRRAVELLNKQTTTLPEVFSFIKTPKQKPAGTSSELISPMAPNC